MENLNLKENKVPKYIAIISSILIPISFVLFVDLIKRIAKTKLIKKYELQDDLYREKELKFFLPCSFIYLIFILLTFIILGPYINFNFYEIYFSNEYNKPIFEKIWKTILIQIINLILYTGLLIQFVTGIEYLYPRSKFIFFMEVIYGPFLEEFIYRGILFTLLKQAGFNGYLSAIFSSITFSLSHFRHIFDVYFDKSDMKRLYFQSFYTLFFGFYTSYAYNYSGSIFSSVILHGVCNVLQLPRLNYLNYDISPKLKSIINFGYIFGILSWIILIFIFH
jgi:membrane protease YdiL (CAAX protease family)